MFAEKNKVVNITTLIGKTTKITGDIVTKENIRVDGQVIGDITTENIANMSETSHIEGKILGDEIYVAGKVNGNIVANKTIELAKTAVITGDIITAKLHIHSGATFNGNTKMGANIKHDESHKTNPPKPEWLEKKQ